MKLLGTILFIMFQSLAFSQDKNNPILKVNATLIAHDSLLSLNSSINYFYAELSVTNVTDSAVKFAIMSCSWPNDNWITNNDSIFIKSVNCDVNTSKIIELLPFKSIRFFVHIAMAKEITIPIYKVGFCFYKPHQIFEMILHSKQRKPEIIWSNLVMMRSFLNSWIKGD